jgi:hypothetical protein
MHRENGSPFVRSLRYFRSYLAGAILGRVPLHVCSLVPEGDEESVVKTRLGLSACLIPLGNLLLRWQAVGTRVLSLSEWQARELAVAGVQPWRSVRIAPRAVIQPRWPGVTLDRYLATEPDQGRRQSAIHSAWESLRQLHTLNVTTEGMPGSGFSHGDATTRNVIYDHVSGRAVWIDFDIAHQDHLSPTQRQADDLRAFLFSVARRIPLPEFDQVAADCLGRITDVNLWQALFSLVTHAGDHPNGFHMAQHGLGPSACQQISRTLIARLRDVPDQPH